MRIEQFVGQNPTNRFGNILQQNQKMSDFFSLRFRFILPQIVEEAYNDG